MNEKEYGGENRIREVMAETIKSMRTLVDVDVVIGKPIKFNIKNPITCNLFHSFSFLK